MTLRSRMLGFLLIGGLLPVVVVAAFIFFYLSSRLQSNLAGRLAISAEAVRDKLDRELYDGYRELKTLADDPALAADPAAALARFSRSRKRYMCLSVVRADGAALAESGACESSGPRDRLYGPRPGATFTAATRALKDGAPVMDVYLPLAQTGAEAFGLKATLDLRPLSDLLVRQKLAGGLAQDVVVYSLGNQILARKNGDPAASLPAAFPLLDGTNTASAYAARGATGGGHPALAAVNTLAGLGSPLDALKWRVAVVQPLDDPSEQTLGLLDQLRRILAIAALIAAVVSSASWLYFTAE